MDGKNNLCMGNYYDCVGVIVGEKVRIYVEM